MSQVQSTVIPNEVAFQPANKSVKLKLLKSLTYLGKKMHSNQNTAKNSAATPTAVVTNSGPLHTSALSREDVRNQYDLTVSEYKKKKIHQKQFT